MRARGTHPTHYNDWLTQLQTNEPSYLTTTLAVAPKEKSARSFHSFLLHYNRRRIHNNIYVATQIINKDTSIVVIPHEQRHDFDSL